MSRPLSGAGYHRGITQKINVPMHEKTLLCAHPIPDS